MGAIEPTQHHVTPPEPSGGSAGPLMQRASAGLSPWQQLKTGTQIARRREKLVRELARIEDETMLAEATVVGRGAVKARTEQVELALHHERQRCLVAAAQLHDDTMAAVARLSEDTRAIFGAAMSAVSLRYAQGVERRSTDR